MQSHPGGPRDALAVPGGARDSLADEGDGVGGLGEALGDEQEEDGLGQEHRDHQGHLLTTWGAGELGATLPQVPLPVSHPKGPHMGLVFCCRSSTRSNLGDPTPCSRSYSGVSWCQDVPTLGVGVSP